jgi:RNA polymerase sigma-70 factor (ECF subfamily)
MLTVQPDTHSVAHQSASHSRVDARYFPTISWIDLVQGIKSGDQCSMEELYRVFLRGMRLYLTRQLGPQELEDKMHDTFLTAIDAIKKGDLREPCRLMGFVRTIVRRKAADHMNQASQTRRDCDDDVGAVVDATRNPEERVIGQENGQLMTSVLRSMSHRDCEILTRFYLHEQSPEQICQDMALSETQFRIMKSRAKARFGEIGRRRLQKKPGDLLLRRPVRVSRTSMPAELPF